MDDPLHKLKELTCNQELPEDDREVSSIAFCFFRSFQCKQSAKEANQSEIWSWEQIDGTG